MKPFVTIAACFAFSAGLSPQTFATPTYLAKATLTSPTLGQTFYPDKKDSDGFWYATIPFTATNFSVEIDNGTPGAYIRVVS